MRTDVVFESDGLNCAGWKYVPDDYEPGQKGPAIVMAHGFGGTKEQGLHNFAQPFADRGFVVLVFDYRYLGASEGEPRGQIVPQFQRNDFRNGISWLMREPEVDPDRIGIWGTSYGGGNVLHLASFERRIKAAVAQVPVVSGWGEILRTQGVEAVRRLQNVLADERTAAYPSPPHRAFPMVAKEEGEMGVLSAMGDDQTERFLGAMTEDMKENWIDYVTFETMERMLENDPTAAMEIVSPTPLMIIAAEDDFIPIEMVRSAFARVGEPKKLVEFPVGHWDIYFRDPWHAKAIAEAGDWFAEHL